ncbi:hypothetical protein ACIA8O_06460 [Kitasatospora sp. NPDC051853]|uniref:hypothetical protein n=1 Tax=Kitasatospora sp. NPDC051853 TaxID=3364058 RepID=UPI0037BB9E89
MEEQQELRRAESVPVQADEPTARLQPVQTTERLAPLEPMQVTDRMAPLEPMQVTDRMAPLEPMQVTDRMAPTEPLHATDRMAPLEPMQVRDRMAPLEPMQVDAPTAARVAADAVEPTAPLRARVAARPVESTERAVRPSAPAGGPDSGPGFTADPERYRAAAGPVLAASDQLADMARGLQAYMSGMSGRAPWGNDDSGEKFANGEKGYLTYSGKVLEGIGNLPTALKYIADGLKVMAQSYDNTEEGLSTGLTSMEAELPETALFHPDLAMRDIAKGRPHHTGRP